MEDNTSAKFKFLASFILPNGILDWFDFIKAAEALRFSSSVPSDDIVYCVNFKNDGGSAILAANTAVKDSVVCVTDKGSITAADIFLTEICLYLRPF